MLLRFGEAVVSPRSKVYLKYKDIAKIVGLKINRVQYICRRELLKHATRHVTVRK